MVDAPEIDYARLGKAIEFYRGRGYAYVEAPWAVPQHVTEITAPPAGVGWVQHLGALVGSAEQSFLALDLDGRLRKGKFVACTPCFRIGDHRDDLHFQTFMKVELYRTDCFGDGEDSRAEVVRMAHEAWTCLRAFTRTRGDINMVETEPDTFDLELNGIEVGSYGIRQYGSHRWVYGTGLAEPRFGQALRRG